MGVKITIFVLLTIMVISLSVGISLIFFTDDYYTGPKSNRIEEISQFKSYNLDSINDIDIKTISSEINLIPTSTDKIKIHFHGSSNKKDKPELVTKKIDDKLVIEIVHPILFFDFYTFKDTQLDIEIPSKYSDQMKIETISGNIFFERFNLEKLDLDVVSGDITGKDFSSDNIYLESISGNIDLSQFSSEITANTVSGDVSLNYNKLSADQDIETVSGNVKLYFPRSSDFYLDFDTISGNIKNQFQITTDNSGHDGLQGKIGSGIFDVDIDTISGDLSIYN